MNMRKIKNLSIINHLRQVLMKIIGIEIGLKVLLKAIIIKLIILNALLAGNTGIILQNAEKAGMN